MALNKDFKVKNGLTVTESLSVGGDTKVNALTATTFEALTATFNQTIVTTTSSLSVVNNGTGPALTVQQDGTHPIAHFIDKNGKDIIFHDDGKVSIGSRTAVEQLTVTGNISATGGINTAGGLSAMNVLSANNYFAGNVGIGTTAPDHALDVAGNIGMNQYLYHNDDGDTYLRFAPNLVNLVAGGKSALKYEASTGKIFINNTNQDVDLQVMADGGDVLLHTDAGAKTVGINTTTPEQALTVSGNISANGSLSASGTGYNYFESRVGINTPTPDYMLDVAGSVGIGACLIHNNDDDTFIHFTDDDINFQAGGVNFIDLTQDTASEITFNEGGADVDFRVEGAADNGLLYTDAGTDKVGIGTRTPTEKLTVTGNLTATGSLSAAGSTDNYFASNIHVAGGKKVLLEDDKATYIQADSADRLRSVVGGKQMLLLDQDTGDRAVFGFGTKVGINIGNNTTPASFLTVAGDISASNGICTAATTNGFMSAGRDLADIFGCSSGDITGVTAGTGLNGGGSTGSVTLNVDAAQTGISCITNTSLDVGRDADNLVKFGTDNEITFRVGGGDGVTFKSSGEIEATSLDIEGDVDINGKLETDELSIAGTDVDATAAELNQIHSITDGTVAANKAVIVDTNKDITGFRNITLTGELDAASLDIEGDADINGTLETDALSINDVTVTSTATELNTLSSTTFDVQSQLQALSSNKLAKTGCAADSALLNGNNSSYFQTAITTSARVGANCIGGGTVSNAEFNQLSGVTFDIQSQLQALSSNSPGDITSVTAGTGLNGGGTGGDVTLNVDAAQTGITSIFATDLKVGEDDQTKIDFETADEIHFYANNAEQVFVSDGVFGPQTDSDVDLGSTMARWKDAYVDSITVTGEVDGASLDISGNADIDGTLEADAITVNDVALSTVIQQTTVDNATNATSASVATHVVITDNESANEENEIPFVEDAAAPGACRGLESDSGFTYNPSSGTVTADKFEGCINQATQGCITSLGTLTTLTVDDITINGSTISDGADLTIDAEGDITLDANGGDFKFQDNGVDIIHLTNVSDSPTFESKISNADIVFKGNDGGSSTTALTLDMSDAGTATFNNKVCLGDEKLVLNGTAVTATGAELNYSDGVCFNIQTQLEAISSNKPGFVTGVTAGTGLNGGGSTGDVTVNVDAAQPTITSLGTLTTLTVDDITINGSTISDAGDLTIDVEGDICLDANGGDICLLDDGTAFGRLFKSSNDFFIKNPISDGDIKFQVNDGGSGITAFQIDASDAGAAQFNNDLTVQGDLIVKGDVTCKETVVTVTSALSVINTGTGPALTIQQDGSQPIAHFIDKNGDDIIFADDGKVCIGNSKLVLNGTTVTRTAAQINAATDCEGTVTSVGGGDGLTGTVTSTGNLAVGAGTGITVNTNDVAVTAAQTGITSVKNTSLVIGRDADNDIDFATDNNIIFRTSGADQIVLKDGVLEPITDNDVDLGSNLKQFRCGFFNDTLEADAITVGGTALATVIANTTVTDAQNATNSCKLNIADNEDTNEDDLIPFIEGGSSAGTGNVRLESDGDFHYNPSTGRVTATQLAGTLQTASQPNVTSLGTLTTLTVDDITINGSTISDGADLTIDAEGDITLDANGADVILKDDGTEFGRFKRDSSDFVIKSATNDKDIVFRGVDNTATITALTLDMSDAGTAAFNNKVCIGNSKLVLNGTTVTATAAELNAATDCTGTVTSVGGGTGLTSTGGTTPSLSVDAAQTGITSLLATDIKIGEDDQTKIDFETADEIHFYANNTEQVYLGDNIFGPQSDSDVDLGSSGVRFKDAFVDSITVTGEVDAASLDIAGNVDIDGSVDVGGSLETDGLSIESVTVCSNATQLNTLSSTTSDVQSQLAQLSSIKQDTITGAATTITSSDLTASRALVANGSGKVAVSDVTSTEISYLDGVDFNIQSQLQALSSGAASGDITGVTAGTGLNGGGTSGSVTLNLDAAQTGITSILATDLKIGEDDQTKIDFETADEIHFYANNTEQVYLGDNIFGPQSDSDVDLGSSSVRWKDAYVDSINVSGDSTVAGKIVHDGDTDTFINFTDDDINIQAGGVNFIDLTQDTVSEITFNEAGANVDFRVEGDSDANLLFVDGSADKVGIGTNGPQSLLHVGGGDLRLDNNQQYLAETAAGGTIGVAKMDSSDNLLIGDGNLKIDVTGTSARMTIDSAGCVGIGIAPTQKLHIDGNTLISSEKYYHTGGTGAGYGSDASSNIKIKQNGSDLVFGSGDNIGIGTSSPDEKLTVTGNISACGNITSQCGTVCGKIVRGLSCVVTGKIDSQFVSNVGEVCITSGCLGCVRIGTSNAFAMTLSANSAGTPRVGIGTSTPGDALTVQGNISGSGDICLQDNGTLRLGQHNDLQLSHDGTNGNILYCGPNRLQISGGSCILIGYNNSGSYDETAMTMQENGAVTIRHDNSTKFSTTATGVSVTGELAATSLDISDDVDIDGTLEADAITVAGATLASVIQGTTVTTAQNATNSCNLNIADNESTDENDLIPFIADAGSTGNVALESDGDFHYNPSSGTVTATVFKGNIDAVDGDFDGTLEADAITVGGTALNTVIAGVTVTNATNAAHVCITDNESTNEENQIAFVENAAGGTANRGLEADGDFTYNPSTGTVTATCLDISNDVDIDGTLEADAITIGGTTLNDCIAGTTVTNALHISVADNESTNENDLIPFIENASSTGCVGLESDGDFHYNPSTGTVTATHFSGTCVTGTLETAAQPNVTSLGTLGSLTVDEITINADTITATDDFIIDAVGDITLDAADNQIFFKDSGTTVGTLTMTSSDLKLISNVNDKDMIFAGTDNNSEITALCLDMSDAGTAIFNHNISLPSAGEVDFDSGDVKFVHSSNTITLQGGALAITGDGSNAATLTESGAGILTIATADDFVVDAEGDINLDANGADIRFKDNGTIIGAFANDSSDFVIKSGQDDKDIKFCGSDGGANITALTLDMSDAGSASFNHDVTVAGDLTVNGDFTCKNTIVTVTSALSVINTGTGPALTIQQDGSQPIAHFIDKNGDDIIFADDGKVCIGNSKLVLNGTTVTRTAAQINAATDCTGTVTSVGGGDGLTGSVTSSGNLAVGAGTGITVNANDVAVTAAQTGITSILATDLKVGEDDQTKIDFETADEIHFYAANAEQVYVADGIFGPQTDSDVDLGSSSVRWKSGFLDNITVGSNSTLNDVSVGNLDVETGLFCVCTTTDASSSSTGAARFLGGVGIAKKLYVGTDLDVDGTTNLDAVDIDGNVQVDGTICVGSDGTGYDVKFFGDASGEYMQWDTSEAKLKIVHTDESVGLEVYTNAGASSAEPQLKVGRGTTQYYGVVVDDRCANLIHRQDETSGSMETRFLQWDSNTSDTNATWKWMHGNGSGGSLSTAMTLSQGGNLTLPGNIDVDGTTNLDAVDIDGAVQIDSTITVGADDTGYDVKFFGDTASAYMLWDASADDLILGGAAGLCVAGNADIDGTLEADAITINGTTLNDCIVGTTVTNAQHISVADNESTNENDLIPFIENGSSTGCVGLESDGDFHYNPSTGTVTATVFSGNFNGCITQASQTNITSLGTLNALNVSADATITGSLVIDDMTLNASNITDAGDFYIDVGGDLTLDAGGGNVYIKDDGTTIGQFFNDSSNFVVKSEVNDKDLIFKGVDNSVNITALTLDMSDAGTATFNNKVCIDNSKLVLNGTTVTATAAELNAATDCTGTVTSVDDGNGLTGGAITGSGSLAVGAGTGITVNTNDVAVTAAQTGITSIKNTSLNIGRDNDNLIKFDTDNQIVFEVGGGDGVTFKSSGEIEATSLDISGNTDIDGNLNVGGHMCACSKAFVIDHPTKPGKKLKHGAVEAPEWSVHYRGSTDKDHITLPDYWEGLVRDDSVTAMLTPVKEHQNLYVVSQDNNHICVGGVTGCYNYIVYGERKDISKLEVETDG